jgi:hypothetical protein
LQISVPLNGASGTSTCTGHAIVVVPEYTEELGVLVDANGNIQGSANYNAATGTPYTTIMQWKRQNVPYTASGDLPDEPARNAIYYQISYWAVAGDSITNLTVVNGGKTLRNVSWNVNAESLCKRGLNELGLDPQRMDLVADYASNNPGDALDVRTSNDFTVTPTIGGAGTGKNLVRISKVYLAHE